MCGFHKYTKGSKASLIQCIIFVLQDLTEDLSAVQTRWLSDQNRSQTSTSNYTEPKTPDIEGMDMDTYSKSIYAMNDSLHDLQSDIHRLAQQQSQIQQMMHHPSAIASPQRPPMQQPPSGNPMDPQPFYISQPDPPPQRRTWGQPQPISFAHQGPGGGVEWPQQPPRRAQWGQPQRPPMMFDPYSGAPIDQWGNPVPPHHYNGYYHHHQAPPQYSAYTNPTYGGPQQQGPPQQQQQGPNGYNQQFSPRTPFRLHDGSGSASPSPVTATSTPKSYGSSSVQQPPVRASSSTLPMRRLSESQNDHPSPGPMSPGLSSSKPSYSRQASRDSVSNSVEKISSPNLPPRRPHTSVPAPEADEMAPQNVSFIDSSADDADAEEGPAKRLSQLNITSGSKTYRVVHDNRHEMSSSPSPTRQRPTLSSAFKQSQRRGSDHSGPSSLRSNSGVGLTEEEAEMLAAMKTEKLKDDTDASKGFVISFDNDTPKKPKPQLKQRRLSSKKNSLAGQSEMSSDGSNSSRKENVPPELMICIDMNTGDDSAGSNETRTFSRSKSRGNNGLEHWRSYQDAEPLSSDQETIPKFEVDPQVPLETMVALDATMPDDQSDSEDQGSKLHNTGLIIGDDLVRAKEPGAMDEMQRKKERIMMQSLRRKQQAEENRLRKLEEERLKREEEARKEEEKNRKKEEEKARRDAILEQHRLKKEMDKANEEVNILTYNMSHQNLSQFWSILMG